LEKIKLLYVITALNIGGAEMMLYRMLKSLEKDRYEIKVVSIINKGAVGNLIHNDLGIEVYALGISNFIGIIYGIGKLKKYITNFKPEIVHSHMVHANLITRVTRLLYRFPVLICTVHNLEEKGSKKSGWIREMLYRLTDPLCDLTTQVSRIGLEKYIGKKIVSPNKIVYIPNGIDLRNFTVDKNNSNNLIEILNLKEKFVLLAVGSLTIQKDYPNMLKAIKMVKPQFPELILLIAGSGPLMVELKNLAKELEIDDTVVFLGIRNDIPDLMSLADLYIISSSWEGLPIVLLEAAASKLPIVATEVGGNSEVVINNKNGFVVPAKNAEALSKSIVKIVNMNGEERNKMGEYGFNYVKENYALDKILNRWEQIYSDMVSGRMDHVPNNVRE
jgi:glycosyltransferase involved in cell wall biosynthesis